ncbi:MAG: hypothetical protein AAGH15_02555 [Myxococcota bacterium]
MSAAKGRRRRARGRQAALGLWLAALAPGAASADWLVALPACGQPAHEVGAGLRLAYPRPGLPALVEAGDELVIRARVAAPLTPAPGIQNPRALRGFHARLEGRSVPLGGSAPAEHVYDVRVRDVRSEGPTGRLMQVRVRVPPWAAPGTYDLFLAAMRSGHVHAAGVVRVLAPGATPRLARLPANPDAAALAHAPVDVWVAERLPESLARPEPGEGLPVLAADADARLAIGGSTRRLGCAGGDALEASAPPALGRLEARDGSLRNGGDALLELWLRVPEGVPTALVPAPLGAWPSTNVRPVGRRPGRVLRVQLGPGERLQTRAGTPAASPRITPPERATAHAIARVRVAARGATGIALAWEEDGMAWIPGEEGHAELTPRTLGAVELHALALTPEHASRAQAALRVETYRRAACAAAGPEGALPTAFWPLAALLGTLRRARYAGRARVGRPRRGNAAHAVRRSGPGTPRSLGRP